MAKKKGMTLPTVKILPSGRAMIQVMVDGKRQAKTFDTEDEAIYWASGLKTKQKEEKSSIKKCTVGQAIDRYIAANDGVLSPTTIDGYKRKRKNTLQGLMSMQIGDLTREAIQKEVNEMAKTKSPKTVRDAFSLVNAAIKFVTDGELQFAVKLPQKIKYEPCIPQEDDIEKIIKAARGTNAELPILLCLCLGLRTSEIRGLKWENVDGTILHIQNALVDADGEDVLKTTKTVSSDRYVEAPQYIADLIQAQKKTSEYVIPLTRRQIYDRFQTVCKKAGVGHFRFYDLRHANASIMLQLNIPDKYAMEEMGHSTTNMLKTVYQHTFTKGKLAASAKRNAYFDEKLQTKLQVSEEK